PLPLTTPFRSRPPPPAAGADYFHGGRCDHGTAGAARGGRGGGGGAHVHDHARSEEARFQDGHLGRPGHLQPGCRRPGGSLQPDRLPVKGRKKLLANPLTSEVERAILISVTPMKDVKDVGLWRSLVARLHGAQEVVGSNPASPTKKRPSVSGGFFHADVKPLFRICLEGGGSGGGNDVR